MDFSKAKKNLERNGFEVHVFKTGREAKAYLNGELDGTSIGFGGSKTLDQLGLFESLSEHNDVYWHWRQDPDYAREKSMTTDVYMCSANGLAETGEIVFVPEYSRSEAVRGLTAFSHIWLIWGFHAAEKPA